MAVTDQATTPYQRERIARRLALHLFCLALGAAGLFGCHARGEPLLPGEGGFRESQSLRTLDPQRIQAENMNFADRYVAAMAEEYDRAKLAAKTPQAAIMAQRLKILAGAGAMGNACDPNPVVGLMDMAMMATLTYEIAREKWAVEMFGPETADAIVAALKIQQADAWRTAGYYLTPAQIEELHQLTVRWRAAHPEQRYVAGARLADFPEARSGGGGGGSDGGVVGGIAGGAAQVAGGVFGLVSLDPFHGLDPAVKEVAESRVLAERLFFYLRHTPVMMTWQADTLFDQMLAQPQMTKLFADTTTVAGSTTRFTEATSRFSDASNSVAQSVEKFRLQLPDQQTKLVAELNDLIARQRDGALREATTQVSAQRDAAIQQLGATVTAQQDLMTRNLQTVTDQSIDRAYQRARALVLITVGAILAAVILYKLFAAARSQSKTP